MNSSSTNNDIPEYTKKNILIGSSYILICVIFMIIQILTFITLIKSHSFTKNIAFKIIFITNIITFFEQFGHLVSGFYIILHAESDNIFGNFVGALLQSSYMASVYLVTLLTINRFDILFCNLILPQLDRDIFYKVFFILFYLYFLANFVFCVIPSYRLFFNLNVFSWNFYKEKPGPSLGYTIESNVNFVLLVVSFILYLAIIGKIFYLRTLTTNGKILKLEDIKLFLQAIFSYFTILILEICWGNWSYFTQNQIETTIIVNYLFIFVCGSNAVLGIIIISEIRHGIKKLICGEKKIKENAVSVNPMCNNFTGTKK